MFLWISKHSFTIFLLFKIGMPLEYWQSCASRNFRYTNLFHSSPPLLPVISLKVKVLVAQLYLTLCYRMHCSPSASSGIFQVRILAWVAIAFPRGSSWPRDWTRSLALQADSLPSEPSGKPRNTWVGSLFPLQGIFPTQGSNLGLLNAGGFFTSWATREAQEYLSG